MLKSMKAYEKDVKEKDKKGEGDNDDDEDEEDDMEAEVCMYAYVCMYVRAYVVKYWPIFLYYGLCSGIHVLYVQTV